MTLVVLGQGISTEHIALVEPIGGDDCGVLVWSWGSQDSVAAGETYW